jgi:hypothetical protein
MILLGNPKGEKNMFIMRKKRNERDLELKVYQVEGILRVKIRLGEKIKRKKEVKNVKEKIHLPLVLQVPLHHHLIIHQIYLILLSKTNRLIINKIKFLLRPT